MGRISGKGRINNELGVVGFCVRLATDTVDEEQIVP